MLSYIAHTWWIKRNQWWPLFVDYEYQADKKLFLKDKNTEEIWYNSMAVYTFIHCTRLNTNLPQSEQLVMWRYSYWETKETDKYKIITKTNIETLVFINCNWAIYKPVCLKTSTMAVCLVCDDLCFLNKVYLYWYI